jgi:hypothetical protein
MTWRVRPAKPKREASEELVAEIAEFELKEGSAEKVRR